MNGSDVLSFIRKPKITHLSSVHDRLYNDFSIRNYENRIQESQVSSVKRKTSPSHFTKKIEESLTQRQIHSESRLKKLKAKYEAEEMKEVRPTPQINEKSRQIVSQSSGKSFDSKSNYIISIINNSRFSKLSKNSGLRTPKNVILKLEDPEVDEKKSFSQSFKALGKYKDVINSRLILLHPEETPSLDNTDRSHDWISERIAKLQTLKVGLSCNSIQNSAVSPILTLKPLKKSHNWSRTRSVSTSYSDIYKLKKLKKSGLNKTLEKPLEKKFFSPKPRNLP